MTAMNWLDAFILAAVTAGVWTYLYATADKVVAEARRKPRRPRPSRLLGSGLSTLSSRPTRPAPSRHR